MSGQRYHVARSDSQAFVEEMSHWLVHITRPAFKDHSIISLQFWTNCRGQKGKRGESVWYESITAKPSSSGGKIYLFHHSSSVVMWNCAVYMCHSFYLTNNFTPQAMKHLNLAPKF